MGATVQTTEQQRKANVRLALILASMAAVFALGFVAKIWWMGA
ncbi:cytochrome oxidase small assembly protein [Rubrivivax sp. RP6-9]